MTLRIVSADVSGVVDAPPSKSHALRAVAATLLAGGGRVVGAGSSEDVVAARRAAEALSVGLATGACSHLADSRSRQTRPDLSGGGMIVDAGESGLAARLFACVAALGGRPVTLVGHGTLLSRPMMLEPLRQLGVGVSGDLLPVTVHGPLMGGEVGVDGAAGSQMVSGLLMTLPLAMRDSVLRVANPVSTPYIDMTLDTLARSGVEISREGHTEFFVRGGQRYAPREWVVEGDWSGASCILVAGATCGRVTVRGLDPKSRQADVGILDALGSAGVLVVVEDDSVSVARPPRLTAFEFDATDRPDLFPALVALAAACGGVSRIAGVGRLRHKESDRARALRDEFGKMGISVAVSGDAMLVTGGVPRGATVFSHGDHRMAMSLAVSALRARSEVTLEGAGAVAKSYPAFWNDLFSITGRMPGDGKL